MNAPILALLILIGTLLALTAFLLYQGWRRAKSQRSIEERLSKFADRKVTLEELERELPFLDRVIVPFVLWLAERIGNLTPQRRIERTRQALIRAGHENWSPTVFVGVRILMALALGGLMLLIGVASGLPRSRLLILPIFLALTGWTLPGVWLNQQIRSRQQAILKALPDAIDLLSISVEAGLGLDAAMQRVAEKWDNPLAREFGRVLKDIRLGARRADALKAMAERVGVPEVQLFVTSVVQADQLGVSITKVLRVQAEQMRIRRRQRAQELAQQAPLKMLFPMIFLIFPALFVVILGPAIPQVIDALSGLR